MKRPVQFAGCTKGVVRAGGNADAVDEEKVAAIVSSTDLLEGNLLQLGLDADSDEILSSDRSCAHIAFVAARVTRHGMQVSDVGWVLPETPVRFRLHLRHRHGIVTPMKSAKPSRRSLHQGTSNAPSVGVLDSKIRPSQCRLVTRISGIEHDTD